MPHDHCPVPYPQMSEAIDAARTVIAKITGSATVEKNCAIHCGYVVAGFALSQVFPDDAHPHARKAAAMDVSSAIRPDADVKAELQRFVDNQTKGIDAGAAAVPWLTIAIKIWDLIQLWMRSS